MPAAPKTPPAPIHTEGRSIAELAERLQLTQTEGAALARGLFQESCRVVWLANFVSASPHSGFM